MRRSKKDWFDVGLKVLGELGLSSLTIERLTGDLGVTKGSFYHHFKNVEDFQRGLITYWGNQYLSTSSTLPDTPGELSALLDTIMDEGFGSLTEPETTIRAWAHQDEMVRSVVEQVDIVRGEFIFKVFSSVVENDEIARLMTDMFSAMLVGSMMVFPRMSPERVTQLYREFKRLYRL